MVEHRETKQKNEIIELLGLQNETEKIEKQIIGCVEQILKAKEANPQSNTQDLESQIDSLIYSLYSLTPEEITIIEGEK